MFDNLEKYPGPYSTKFKGVQSSSILINGESINIKRIKRIISSIKCCRNNVEICNVPHSGVFEKYTYSISEISNVLKSEEELAKVVFFNAQLKFPTPCKHEGISLLDRGNEHDNYVDRQNRNTNWTFMSGQIINIILRTKEESGRQSSQISFDTPSLESLGCVIVIYITCSHFKEDFTEQIYFS